MDVPTRDKGVYVFGPFRLDPVRRTLTREGAPVKLAARLFDTLLYLAEHQGRLVEKEELLAAIWGSRTVEEANLTQTIYSLRKLLQTNATGDGYIATVPGRGYRFSAPTWQDFGAADVSPGTQAAPAPPPIKRPEKLAWWHRPAVPGALALALVITAGLVSIRFARQPDNRSAPVTLFAPPPRSVAVLAFTNMSGDPAQEYLTDGLSEELIDSLARVDTLQVAARTSSFFFKTHPATIADIGRRLNVSAVLEGSVRRDGPRLRITAQLIDATTGYHFWSHSYDRDFGDILKLQAQIAEDVTRSLLVTLQPGDTVRLAMGGTNNSAAFDAFLRGMKSLHGRDEAAYRAALAAFDEALLLDAHFAAAQVKRAFTLMFLSDYLPEIAAVHAMLRDAMAAANQAVALAPDWGASHAARGGIFLGLIDLGAAESELSKARELAPGDAGVDATYAFVEAYLGHHEAAETAAARVVARFPLDTYVYADQGQILYFTRNYAGSLAAYRHVRDLGGKLSPGDQLYTALDQLGLGKLDLMRQDCAPIENRQLSMCLAILSRRLGLTDEAAAQLKTYRAQAGDTAAYQYAEIFAQWGDPSNALHWLETALGLRDTGLVMLRADPLLDPIRNEPRFKAMEARLHFPP